MSAGPSKMVSRDCACGGRPQWQPAGGRPQGHPRERLVCAECGRAVGPAGSRQQLAAEWNLGGWREERGAAS